MDTAIDNFLSINYLFLSLKYFFLLILIEAGLSVYRSNQYYRLNDSINSLSLGAMGQLFGLLFNSSIVFVYLWLQTSFGLYDFTLLTGWTKIAALVVLLFAVDLGYYCFHRSSHRVNLGWATHIPHHQSEDYNLTTALRQGSFQRLYSFVFYLPLAIIGFPTTWFLAISSIDSAYQIWIHTRYIKKMPRWFEFIFNTPSHHRVHHASNFKYLDKNYAGIFIIWDKMFGTFKAEEDEPKYGITHPLNSWNPIWANLHYFSKIYKQSCNYSWSDKLKVWFMPPGWTADAQKFTMPEIAPKYHPQVPLVQNVVSFIVFIIAFAATYKVMFITDLSFQDKTLVSTGLILLFLLAGILLEKSFLRTNYVNQQSNEN